MTMFKREDYLSVKEMASEFSVSTETIRRWIRKGYIEKQWLEVHAGQYYVHKDGANAWRAKLREAGGGLLRGKAFGPTISLLQFV